MPQPSYHPLYTLGYSGWTPEQVAHEVTGRGAVLLDIRFAPWSKAPQWQQASLQRLLGSAYRHVKALGNVNYRGDGPITLADPPTGVEAVRRALAERPVILMCGCRDYWTCHREDAADLVAQRLGLGITDHLSPPLAPPAPPTKPQPPAHALVVDWPALRAALARGAYQAAYGAAGLSRDAADYRAARDEIEAAKAAALAQLTQAWRESR